MSINLPVCQHIANGFLCVMISVTCIIQTNVCNKILQTIENYYQATVYVTRQTKNADTVLLNGFSIAKKYRG